MQSKLSAHFSISGLIIGLLLGISFSTHAQADFCSAQTLEHNTQMLHKLYQTDVEQPSFDIQHRIDFYSSFFLRKPYALTALGEGMQDEFDQAPLYQFDTFDCQTYVETILALALADSPRHFKTCLRHIRYQSGHISYLNRNHFVSPDWNHNNHQLKILTDITPSITDQHHHSVACHASAIIDVPNWYQHFDSSKIRRCDGHADEQRKYLKLLQEKGMQLSVKTSYIAYIPFSALFDKNDRANTYVFDQIPDAAVIEIVRPNWDLKKAIGTNLNVSHMGIAIRKQGTLYYYQALASNGFVIQSSLIDYLKSIRSQTSIKGINIQKILPNRNCNVSPQHVILKAA